MEGANSSIFGFYDAIGILFSKEKRKIEKEQRIADLLLLLSKCCTAAGF